MTKRGLYHSCHRLYSEYSAPPIQKPFFGAFVSCEGDSGTIRGLCSPFSDLTEDPMSVVSYVLGKSLRISTYGISFTRLVSWSLCRRRRAG